MLSVVGNGGGPYKTANGAVSIHNANVHNKIVNKHIHQITATNSTLSIATAVGDYQITLTSVAGFAVNDFIRVGTSVLENTHPKIINIVGNVLTIDRQLDSSHTIGESVVKIIIDMAAQVGSISSPQIYEDGPQPGEIWYIMRLLFVMTHNSAGDLGLFGNLSELTNGVLLCLVNNNAPKTISNWKSSSNIKIDLFDLTFDARSGGQGSYGTTGQGWFGDVGAVARLDGDLNDKLQIIVQDDITLLDLFKMKIQGYVED